MIKKKCSQATHSEWKMNSRHQKGKKKRKQHCEIVKNAASLFMPQCMLGS